LPVAVLMATVADMSSSSRLLSSLVLVAALGTPAAAEDAPLQDSLQSDLNAVSCAQINRLTWPAVRFYPAAGTGESCVAQIRRALPALQFSAEVEETPAHAGTLTAVTLDVQSYTPAAVDVAARARQLGAVACVARAQPAARAEEAVSEFTRRRLRERQPERDRTLVLSLQGVADWGEYERCMQAIAAQLGPDVASRVVGLGTPYEIDGEPAYAVLRLFR
jgi:hypothetical protein